MGESNLIRELYQYIFLSFYDLIFVFKNYNIFRIYDYKYYCDFIMLFNLFIQEGVSILGTHVQIRTFYVIIRTNCYIYTTR